MQILTSVASGRYTIPVLGTGLATLLAIVLAPLLPDAPVGLFIIAAAFSAWKGGLGPGLLTTVLGLGGLAVILTPQVASDNLGTGAIPLVRLLVAGLLITLLISYLRHEVARWKHAEGALHRAYDELQTAQTDLARLAAIIEATPDLVAVSDADGHRVYLNPAGRRLLGIGPSTDGSAGRSDNDQPDGARDELLQEILPAVQAQGSWTGQSAYRAADGREVPVLKVVLAHHGAEGAITHYSTIARDISEVQRTEAQLRRAQRMETAGRIAGQVAHDFNNLLAPLVGYPDLIKMRLPEDHPAQVFCDEMLTAAQRMAEINTDLLTLGRRGHFAQEPVSLNQIIQGALKTPCQRPASLEISLRLTPELLPVVGSSAQLHRVVTNLIQNARDAMSDRGRLTIVTENVYLDQPLRRYTDIAVGEYVRLEIADEGTGIPAELQDQIFDAFFTTKTTDKRRGSGLGLSVVQAVVSDHGGYVDFTSAVGEGTVFQVYLPASRDAVTPGAPQPLLRGSESILIVDDDATLRGVLTASLQALGYTVETAQSGEAAVAQAADRQFDLVILDMVMPPGIDGTETFRRLHERHPDQRAILLSGFAESTRVAEAQALGAGAFVRKPVSLEQLSRVVRAELDRASSPSPVR